MAVSEEGIPAPRLAFTSDARAHRSPAGNGIWRRTFEAEHRHTKTHTVASQLNLQQSIFSLTHLIQPNSHNTARKMIFIYRRRSVVVCQAELVLSFTTGTDLKGRL